MFRSPRQGAPKSLSQDCDQAPQQVEDVQGLKVPTVEPQTPFVSPPETDVQGHGQSGRGLVVSGVPAQGPHPNLPGSHRGRGRPTDSTGLTWANRWGTYDDPGSPPDLTTPLCRVLQPQARCPTAADSGVDWVLGPEEDGPTDLGLVEGQVSWVGGVVTRTERFPTTCGSV